MDPFASVFTDIRKRCADETTDLNFCLICQADNVRQPAKPVGAKGLVRIDVTIERKKLQDRDNRDTIERLVNMISRQHWKRSVCCAIKTATQLSPDPNTYQDSRVKCEKHSATPTANTRSLRSTMHVNMCALCKEDN